MSTPAGAVRAGAGAGGLAVVSAPIGLAAASGARPSGYWERGAAGRAIALRAGCCGLAGAPGRALAPCWAVALAASLACSAARAFCGGVSSSRVA